MGITEIIDTLKQSAWGEMLLTFIIAMVPVIELRGAIPFGVGIGLDHWTSMAVAVVGNMLPVPFIILFIRKIFAWLRVKSKWLKSVVMRLENRARNKRGLILKYSALGLMIFVAIPLPGTGAWTGALIAALMNMRIKKALPSIFLGVIIAGFLVTGITFGFTSIFH